MTHLQDIFGLIHFLWSRPSSFSLWRADLVTDWILVHRHWSLFEGKNGSASQFQFLKGRLGFGFSYFTSPMGSLISIIWDTDRCKGLRPFDFITHIDQKDIRGKDIVIVSMILREIKEGVVVGLNHWQRYVYKRMNFVYLKKKRHCAKAHKNGSMSERFWGYARAFVHVLVCQDKVPGKWQNTTGDICKQRVNANNRAIGIPSDRSITRILT